MYLFTSDHVTSLEGSLQMMSFKVERFVKIFFEWGNHGHDQSKKLNSKCLILVFQIFQRYQVQIFERTFCTISSFQVSDFQKAYTLPIEKIITLKNTRTWFSMIFIKIYNRHPLPLKKSKFWEPFWSYQLNSTADLANLV